MNHDAISAGWALWLGTPAAHALFDPATLTAQDRERWLARRNSRRLQEFEVSRALMATACGATQACSLSHSGGHAAVVSASSQWQVGVDLEVSRPRDVLRIARFVFDDAEVAALEAQSDGAREHLFYTLWTLKEALAKALRLPLGDALQHCVFTQQASGWTGSAPTQSPWSVQTFQPRPGFYLSAACVGVSAPALQKWEWPPQRAADWPLIASAAVPASTRPPPA